MKILKELILIKIISQKERETCHYKSFKSDFKFHLKVCNGCDWGIKSFGNFTLITGNGVGYRLFMFEITEEDFIDFVKNIEPD